MWKCEINNNTLYSLSNIRVCSTKILQISKKAKDEFAFAKSSSRILNTMS